MAFGNSILSKFNPTPVEDLDPAYEGLGETGEEDDEVFDFIDNICYGKSFESCASCESDEELLEEGENINKVKIEDDDSNLDDEDYAGYYDDDISLEDIDEDEALLEECFTFVKESFANMTPKQRHDNFVKMVMGNKKLSAAEKKKRIANYEAKHPLKATEALSSKMNQNVLHTDKSFEAKLKAAFDDTTYPDSELNSHAKYSASLKTGMEKKPDLDGILDDILFSGDKKASYSANLKTSYHRAKESVEGEDFDFFT